MALTGWLKAALNFPQGSGSKKKGKSTLAADQRDLAIKLKDSFMALENELAEISSLIQSAEDGDLQAAEKIRSRQAHLRNLATRVKVGFMRSTDLDRESSEWRSLLSSGDIDPAQLVKLEILASELALRTPRTTYHVPRITATAGSRHIYLNEGGTTSEEANCHLERSELDERSRKIRLDQNEPDPIRLASTPRSLRAGSSIPSNSTQDDMDIVDEDVDEGVKAVVLAMDQATHGNESANHLEMEPENLLLGIRQASDELAKYQASDASNEDFVQTLREIRTLHAALKNLDKKSGYCRDRIAETRGFSKIFQSID